MTIWLPQLEGLTGPLYRQICDAIGNAVETGVLQAGDRLPAQRDLAYEIGVSLNTVTRAYHEAIARGLLAGEVGRGTYVRQREEASAAASVASLKRVVTGAVDFSRNLPAPGAMADLLPNVLRELSGVPDRAAFLDFEPEGSDVDGRFAEAGARWIGWSAGLVVSRDTIAPTVGAQHGLLVALMAILGPGDTLLVESLTYAPIKALAQHLGITVVAIPSGGNTHICPEQLDAISRRTGAKALFCMPTLHTPTARTIDADTREAIADVARRNDLTIIEDDVFGFLLEDRPRPLAEYAPERTIYVTGVGKCLGPGLRVGYLHAADQYLDAIRASARLSVWMPPPMTLEIASRWIMDGTAERLAVAQREEARCRQEVACKILGDHVEKEMPPGYHLWLDLPAQWPSTMFLMEAEKRGVKMMPGSVFAVRPSDAPNAVRLCLSHEPDPARVEMGLRILADMLSGEPSDAAIIL